MKRLARIVVIVGLLIGLVGCTAASAEKDFDLGEWEVAGPTELDVDTRSVGVVNSGSLPHTLVVTDSSGRVIAATDLIEPGAGAELELDLTAGTYSFTCRIVAQSPEGEIVDHYEAGMNKMVSVSG